MEIGQDGIITKIGRVTGAADLVFDEELIFPGFIDLHVHARECENHQWDYKEDFYTAGQAAVNGGVTAFADMPNNPVAPVDDKSYSSKQELATKSQAEVLLYAGIGPGTLPLSKNAPYKVFMGQSIGDLFFKNSEELKDTLKYYKGQSVSFHCEDPKVLKGSENKNTHQTRRPPEAEILAVDLALKLIEEFELHGKICHCSTSEALAKIIAAKKRGVDVSVEVAPHHLYFEQDETSQNALLQINPPVRKNSERLFLLEALKHCDIDFLATDHAPHTLEEKQKGISGVPHLDTFGPFVTWLIQRHEFRPKDIARVCSFNPGKFFSRFSKNKYGLIAEGYAGNLTVLNLNKPTAVTKQMLKTKCAWSPFEGETFPGSVSATIIKGKICRAN